MSEHKKETWCSLVDNMEITATIVGPGLRVQWDSVAAVETRFTGPNGLISLSPNMVVLGRVHRESLRELALRAVKRDHLFDEAIECLRAAISSAEGLALCDYKYSDPMIGSQHEKTVSIFEPPWLNKARSLLDRIEKGGE